MSGVLYVDVIGGAAGDMLLAALVDAGAPEDTVRGAVEAVLPGRYILSFADVRRAGLRGRHLRIEPGPSAPAERSPQSRPYRELIGALDGAPLDARVRGRARSVLERLGMAEARVHGVEASDVVMHELGDDDTLLDLVGISTALEALDIGEMFVSAIPLAPGGSFEGRGAHGAVPLPATVTLELLRGFTVRGVGSGETVTPTAAAVFAALGKPAVRFPEMIVGSVGFGAGTRDPQGYPNLVRVIVGSATEAASVATRSLVELEANLDDLSPELVADAAEALLAAGALDAWTTPTVMKKGRPGIVLSALSEPEAEPVLRRVYFEATSTLGIRSHVVQRAELERRMETVHVEGGAVRVKLAMFEGRAVSVKPEHDDVAALARSTHRTVRSVSEEVAALAREFRFDRSER